MSGALLAFQEVWTRLYDPRRPEGRSPEAVRDFATLAGIRDTWQTQDPRWSDACALSEMLLFYPQRYWLGALHPRRCFKATTTRR